MAEKKIRRLRRSNSFCILSFRIGIFFKKKLRLANMISKWCTYWDRDPLTTRGPAGVAISW